MSTQQTWGELFTSNKWSYCVLSSWQELPDHIPSDLDIIVNPQDFHGLEISLHGVNGKLVNLLQHESTCYYFVLAVSDGETTFIPIDAATDYRRDGFIWFTADELLSGRQEWKGFRVAAPEVEFRYLLVKKILKAQLPEYAAARLTELAESLGPQVDTLAESLLGPVKGKQAVTWIRTGNWEQLLKDLLSLQRALKWQRLRQDPLNPIRYWIPEIGRIWRRWTHPTGLWIAVLGPDGAGKSTLLQNLEIELHDAFRRIACFHLMPGLLRRGGDGNPITKPHGKPPRFWLVSLIKLAYYLLDYNLGYLFKIRPALAKSTLVLFDRYYDDLLVDPKRYRYGGLMRMIRLLRRFIPRPDLWIILDVPEEVIVQRKQEVSVEEIGRQREAYRELASELPNSILLDGSLSADEVGRRARDKVLDYLKIRYLSRRKIWFRDPQRDIVDYLEKALKAKQTEVGESYFHLALPDGRGYLLPADSRKAAVAGLSMYVPQKARVKAVKRLLKTGLQTRLGSHLLPLVRLDMSNFLPIARRIFDRSDLVLAISLGVVGPYGKPVVKVMSTKGEILGYVKVGWNGTTCELVSSEFEALSIFNKSPLRHSQFPEVIDFCRWDDRLLLATRPLPIEGGSPPQGFREAYFQSLREVAQKEIKYETLCQSDPWQELQERLCFIADFFPQSQIAALERAVQQIYRSAGNRVLPFVWRLGDFSPWHVKANDQGKVLVIDLENSRASWFPGWDVLHFFHQAFSNNEFKIYVMLAQFEWAMAYFRWLELEQVVPLLTLIYWIDLWSEYAVAWKKYREILPSAALWFAKYARSIEHLAVEISQEWSK